MSEKKTLSFKGKRTARKPTEANKHIETSNKPTDVPNSSGSSKSAGSVNAENIWKSAGTNNAAAVNKSGSSLLHPRNPHQGRYDIPLLCKAHNELTAYVVKNPSGEDTVNFSDPKAVLALNKALLSQYYSVKTWAIPEGFLCPPIPGRADYIHYAADLLAKSVGGRVPVGKKVKVLDVGTGANLVYPIIGSHAYGWQFTASDVNDVSYQAATQNAKQNSNLASTVRVVKQSDSNAMFEGVIKKGDRFALTVCNPPFHSSAEEAIAGSRRKTDNLNRNKRAKHQKTEERDDLNFGGQNSELWCDGGELSFINRMIDESILFKNNVCWFSCLVSRNDHLKPIKRMLKNTGITQLEIIEMAQGQKVSRFIAWSFQKDARRKAWFD